MSNSHLSRIETQWSLVRKAHGSNSNTPDAKAELIQQYGPAVKRYLLASLRNEDAAEEVFQEFALRLVRGDFKNADCEKGKFRSMLKTAVYRLMIDYHRRKKKNNKLGGAELNVNDIATETDWAPVDDSFSIAWRDSLLDQAWDRLEQLQIQTGKPYFTALRMRVDHPEMTTKQLYKSMLVGGIKQPSESSFRVFLHRCRKRFATILLEQVTLSLQNPTDEEIELELIELGLHHYLQS